MDDQTLIHLEQARAELAALTLAQVRALREQLAADGGAGLKDLELMTRVVYRQYQAARAEMGLGGGERRQLAFDFTASAEADDDDQ